MKKYAVSLLLLFSFSAPSMAQTVTGEGQARVVSLLVIVQTQCSKHFTIDSQLVDQFALASAYVGQNTVGKSKFSRIADKELKRREKEVAATGVIMWCQYQRPYLNELGIKAFID